jgi:hypothetical protein
MHARATSRASAPPTCSCGRQDGIHSGVYRLTRDPLAIERAAKAARLAVDRIDIGKAHDKSGFMAQVSKALRFPSFGNNLDALNDCLADLDWLS